jgi:hypothetical protein
LSLHELEADVAYFDARLALLAGRSGSRYQEAQVMVYGELEKVLSGMLNRLRGGVAVEELPPTAASG